MWLVERLQKLAKPKSTVPLEEKKEAAETAPETIYFYDLRDKQRAEESGLSPGYYLTVSSITKAEMEDPRLLNNYSLDLMQTMLEAVPLPKSETKIFVDTMGHYTDPGLGWLFSAVGYESDQQMLIVRADHIDPDEAQKIIVRSFSRKKY